MAVLVLGAFDLALHPGHLSFLQWAARFGNVTVGLSTDKHLAATKRQPILTFDERKRALELAGCKVLPRPETSAVKLFHQVKPDVFVCGNDWLDNGHLESMGLTVEFLNKYNIALVYTPRYDLHATHLIERIRGST